MDKSPPSGTYPVDVPILEFDPDQSAVVNPGHDRLPAMPSRVVLCFFQDVIETIVREHEARPLITLHTEIGPNAVYLLEREVPIALVHPGVGAPLAAGILEELIALGGRVFVAAGSAGALVPELTLGHVIVPTAAVRDEGTSYHYLAPSREATPSAVVVDAIIAQLRAHQVPFVTGKTWTTDAFYRETRAKIARRVAEGCVCVEMEAAACFAVAAFRGVDFGQLLYAGDDLSGEEWDDRGWLRHATGREALLRLAVEAVQRVPVPQPNSPST